MNQRLEAEDYQQDETVTIKIPLTVPYYAAGQDYERITGSFEHQGEFFKLVKQRLERDTLYVVCIKDHQEKRIVNAMTDFVKLSNDLPLSSQKTLKLLSSLIKDFISRTTTHESSNQGWYMTLVFVPFHVNLRATDTPVFSPPPDFLS
jgi:hypothetical protein